ncbi:hypothetical protein E1262_01385 [Jiangella aurantiaca]|uniref:Uncharacterized protein n=1 Tax=Jiangella aurantiaca TaxID=2530373 RepID=A0A4V2YTD5_9ACTN|nr:hypothetical protein [Jiangella aurantiaca]TDD73157.1 hypothetical protein E1262_01385 [Jiangella aurantiaca]
MIDSVRAEIAYRQERVRRDVAATRSATTTEQVEQAVHAAEDRPETAWDAYRRPSRSAARRPVPARKAQPAVPAAPRVRPRPGSAVR